MRQRIEFKQTENVLKDLDRYNCSSTLINVYIQFLIQTRTETKLFFGTRNLFLHRCSSLLDSIVETC